MLIYKVETNKCEVSTSNTDGGELAGGCGSRSQGAKCNDGVCDPELSRPYGYALDLVFGGDRWSVRKDEMVRGKMEGTIDLLTATSQGHIVNLQ